MNFGKITTKKCLIDNCKIDIIFLTSENHVNMKRNICEIELQLDLEAQYLAPIALQQMESCFRD